jgi:inner membrane protein
MFISHLPAGYIASHLYKEPKTKWAVLIGNILPDIDLLYFYTWGERAVVHHAYPTHMPYFWIMALTLCYGLCRLFKIKSGKSLLACFTGIILHLFLDTVTGGIYWLAPLSDIEARFFDVPAKHSHWTLNFILHWTFWIEIAIILIASILFIRNRFFLTQEKPENECGANKN